jgi:spore germination protein KB
LEIAVLGEDITERTIYPLYLLIKQISTVDFSENLDAIVALNMIITAYIKGTIYLFAAVRSFQLLLKIQNSRSINFPVACHYLFFRHDYVK